MNRLTRISLFVVACILAAACVLPLAGCDAPTTQTENEQLAVLDHRITLQTTSIEKLESEASAQVEILSDTDPANDAAAVERLQAIHADYMKLADALQADLAARGTILNGAAERAGAPITGAVATAFPQFAPWILAGGALASRLLAKRSREHLVDAAKAALRGNLGAGLGGLLKSLGYTHSNTDPVDVLEGARAAAEQKASKAPESGAARELALEEADRIRRLAETLQARRALSHAELRASPDPLA